MLVSERILRKLSSHLHLSKGKSDDCLGQWMDGSSRSTMQLLRSLPIPVPWKPCSITAFAFRKGNEYMSFIRDYFSSFIFTVIHPSSFFSEYQPQPQFLIIGAAKFCSICNTEKLLTVCEYSVLFPCCPKKFFWCDIFPTVLLRKIRNTPIPLLKKFFMTVNSPKDWLLHIPAISTLSLISGII